MLAMNRDRAELTGTNQPAKAAGAQPTSLASSALTPTGRNGVYILPNSDAMLCPDPFQKQAPFLSQKPKQFTA